MAPIWLAAAAMTVALYAPGGLSTEVRVTVPPPPTAPAEWTRIAATSAPARWRTPLCAGVAGLGQRDAQYVVDRVSQRAREQGLYVGAPGCTPNVLVIFTSDADGQARSIAAERTDPASRTGVSGQSGGLAALNRFLNADTPVRWLRVTRPMTEAGIVADRNLREGEAPRVRVPERGRLAQTTFDTFSHVLVIVDLAQVNGQRLDALADYVALVSLAPADSPAEVGGASILSLFSEGGPQAMTDADLALLSRLYR
jgi:hypothetical protein